MIEVIAQIIWSPRYIEHLKFGSSLPIYLISKIIEEFEYHIKMQNHINPIPSIINSNLLVISIENAEYLLFLQIDNMTIEIFFQK
jgi:hypothetical protein